MDNQPQPLQEPPMDANVQDSIVARLKEATNVLVTVSNDPSVDQLAACIGFTLLLNKIGKRGAAVFSGAVPSTLEFLQPDKTIEKNTDSLRDFIIALDKTKADKLRYKVEDKVVKIFITPYRTSISDKDLDFSQGDFNVDVVLALGVHKKSELDQAIVSHGRILHDATVISVNNQDQGNLGTLNWVDLQASSLSEMMASVGRQLGGPEAFDNQIATALMTGIVAETDRFSNDKTSPGTMKLASDLMGAGANQQLIAAKLEEPAAVLSAKKDTDKEENGELTIAHNAETDNSEEVGEAPEQKTELELPEPKPAVELDATPPSDASDTENETPLSKIGDIKSSSIPVTQGEPTGPAAPTEPDTPPEPTSGRSAMTEPPILGGKLTANSEPDHLKLDPSSDPLSTVKQPSPDGMLSHDARPAPLTPSGPTPPVSPASPDENKEEQIEDARDAVEDAIEEGGDPEKNLEPIKALGAQPLNLNLGRNSGGAAPAPTPGSAPQPNPAPQPPAPAPVVPPILEPSTPNVPPSPSQPLSTDGLVPQNGPQDRSGAAGPATPPPPVPPPIMPPTPSPSAPAATPQPAPMPPQPPLPPTPNQ